MKKLNDAFGNFLDFLTEHGGPIVVGVVVIYLFSSFAIAVHKVSELDERVKALEQRQAPK